MVLNGHFATTGSMNYRAYKSNFTTYPTGAPASHVYAHNTSAPKYHAWPFIEALDASGKSLRNSTQTTQAFVPSRSLATSCNADEGSVAES